MNRLIIPVLLAGSFIALSTMEASAVVCARGVVRAGCVAAGGGGLEVIGRRRKIALLTRTRHWA
jgi:hypothetical protein